MLLPIRTDSPLRSTPYMNWVLIALNVILYVVQQQVGEAGWRSYMLFPSNPQWYGFVSYAFMHASISHLLGNMLFLYIFGNNVNDKMGNFGYLGFYLAASVAAGMGHFFSSAAPVLGASGAVSAVTGAYLILFPKSSITLIYFFFIIGSIEIPAVYFIVLYFLKDLFGFSGQAGGGVAYGAHIAGTVFGVILSMLLLSVHLLPRDQFDVIALFQRWNKRRQYRDMVNQGYDPFGAGPSIRADRNAPAVPEKIDPKTQRISELRLAIADAVGLHELDKATSLYLLLKEIDPNQVLGRQAQLDIANQLASQQKFTEAADAYERFLTTYPNFEQIEQVELMLGLIYARYLENYDRAKLFLVRAVARLRGERELELARDELHRIEPFVGMTK